MKKNILMNGSIHHHFIMHIQTINGHQYYTTQNLQRTVVVYNNNYIEVYNSPTGELMKSINNFSQVEKLNVLFNVSETNFLFFVNNNDQFKIENLYS